MPCLSGACYVDWDVLSCVEPGGEEVGPGAAPTSLSMIAVSTQLGRAVLCSTKICCCGLHCPGPELCHTVQQPLDLRAMLQTHCQFTSHGVDGCYLARHWL